MLHNDIGFPTINRRKYNHKFVTFSNKTLHYIQKCIRTDIVSRFDVVDNNAYTQVLGEDIYKMFFPVVNQSTER